jgi:tricorn protease
MRLAFGDRRQRLRILDVASGELTEVDRGEREDLDYYAWSPDSRWLVYERSRPNRIPGIAAYSLEQRKLVRLGDDASADSRPVFSADGKHLVFLSNRDYQPTFSAFEFNYLYADAGRVYVAPLSPETPALFPPRSDEEKGEEKPAAAAPGKGRQEPRDAEPTRPEPVRIVAEGFAARTSALPGIKPGQYRSPSATGEALFYLRDGDDSALYRYDLKERKEEKVVDGVTDYALSADGKKLLYRVKADWFVADAKAGLKAGEGKLDLSGLVVKLDPAAEWRQMFEDGWRIARDWFYDENMHGVDWNAMRERYGALVPHLAHRADLDFIFGEMLGELEAGHTYVASGDEPSVTRVQGGMLGCELLADASGRYRVQRIYPGENWDEEFRSPLTEPGAAVKEGSFLLAVDGHELRTDDNPYRLLENKAGKPVVLDVADAASGAGRRQVTVRPVASEQGLFYLDWLRSRMQLVERLSGGKVGYVHLPNTALEGNRMLQKLFYAQAGKPALIVDDRYNGGGFIPDRMIEYFTRRTLSYWARRGIEGFSTPGFAHDGPKAMLVNAYSSSGGDALPYFFRHNNLGPIIGTRTWGGLIGLSGNPRLLDGGAVQIPTFRIYDTQGRWVVENEGVAPDIEVVDLPEARIAGGDPSIEKAVEVLLAELARQPTGPLAPPAPPRHGRVD